MKSDPHFKDISEGRFAYKEDEESFLGAVNLGLQHMDLPEMESREDLPLIYIVGAPRSGTTLLSQFLSRHLDVGYVSNLMARFWARPSVGAFVARAVLGENPDSAPEYKSAHGMTFVPAGPHEFGFFWRHWLKLDSCRTHHLTDEELDRVDADNFKKNLEAEILGSFGKPVVFKTVVAGFAAHFLTRLHSRSLFINVIRDQKDVARSLLRCRKERYGDYETWWSLIPKAWPFDCSGPGEEVALQVRHCCAEIAVELSRPGVTSISVQYEDLCSNPKRVLETIQNSLALWGDVPEIIRNDFRSLKYQSGHLLNIELEAAIARILD